MVVAEISVATPGPGLIEVTGEVAEVVADSGIEDGLCTVFVRHTSASLLIQENADPSVCHDLQSFFKRLVPERDPIWTHTHEGPDDMPSHVRSALTQTSIGIPVVGGRLGLGTWQGIYVWEHRHRPHRRTLLIHVGG